MRTSEITGGPGRAKWNSAHLLFEHFNHKCVGLLPKRPRVLKAKTLIKLRGLILLILLFLQMGLALPIHASPNPVTVSLSPEVEKAIKTANPKTAARMKKAIKVGNKFIKLRFNNEDQYDPEIEDEWNKKVGPIIAMSGEQWQEWWDKRWVTVVSHMEKGRQVRATLISCPGVELSDVSLASSSTFLTYQARLVGTYIEQYIPRDVSKTIIRSIDKTRSSNAYTLQVDVDANGRIVEEKSSEKTTAFAYQYLTNNMRSLANTLAIQGDAVDSKRLNQAIRELGDATLICRTTDNLTK